ncbi:amino acid adenylation domain-containing protein [Lentzea fradiae]|uniref:Amino acid adenylation domain-containing protein n=1 Tax=Lentzea fradiae TaxID=200378 RepID=A0A1G7VJJ3_9PSEU|nr:amino acid adenylation domain-containing protein [Lentzea fradiae]SDG59731.1 amino acid adenylation domain-containing protein [Lentzea fradiae]
MTRLDALVGAQAARTPDAVAIVHGDRRLTYGRLDETASRVANALLAAGLRPGGRVCVLVPKSPEMVVYLLGVLRAGGVCVPLDVASPVSRLVSVVGQVGPCVLLADTARAPLAADVLAAVPADVVTALFVPDGTATAQVPVLDETTLAEASTKDPQAPAGESGVAYLLFTSGSTGEPKGVQLTHDGIAHFVGWAHDHFGFTAEDRISCHLQMHFDGSLWDVYGALSCGAELHLVPPSASLTPTALVEFLRSSRVTQLATVPSVLSAIARYDVLAEDDLPDLRRLVWGGEVFLPDDLAYWMKRLPHVSFTGVYGTTEATIASCFHTVTEPPHEPLPMGVAIPGEDVSVVGEDLAPLPIGEIGEVVIGGVGVTPGYWRSPERTAKAFFERDGRRYYRTGDLGRIGPDGLLRFHGRADRQVKISGYRIELDDLLTALHAVPEVAMAAVVTTPGRSGALEICAAYVPAEEGLTVPVLREAVARRLPAYMVPRRWLELKALPVNANGKTDLMELQRRFAEDEG